MALETKDFVDYWRQRQAAQQLADRLLGEQARTDAQRIAAELRAEFGVGCERIFRLVASDLNGALPTGFDWHKRLLERMAVQGEG